MADTAAESTMAARNERGPRRLVRGSALAWLCPFLWMPLKVIYLRSQVRSKLSMTYTIGGLAKATGIHIETIRYYQRRGLMDEPARPLGGVRRYYEGDAQRLRFIKQAQTLGFSLEEVAELLTLEDGQHCREAEQLGSQKLEKVRLHIAQLQRVEAVLTALVEQCHCNRGTVRCPLIGSLAGSDRVTAQASPRARARN